MHGVFTSETGKGKEPVLANRTCCLPFFSLTDQSRHSGFAIQPPWCHSMTKGPLLFCAEAMASLLTHHLVLLPLASQATIISPLTVASLELHDLSSTPPAKC